MLNDFRQADERAVATRAGRRSRAFRVKVDPVTPGRLRRASGGPKVKKEQTTVWVVRLARDHQDASPSRVNVDGHSRSERATISRADWGTEDLELDLV